MEDEDRTNFIKIIFILIAIIILAFVVYLIFKSSNIVKQQVNVIGPTPTRISQNSNLYPNPSLTLGDAFQNVTVQDICTSGYTKRVRNVPVELKRQVYQEYSIRYPEPRGAYEVDYFIPLELGGSNSIKNLWPEPAEPKPGFHEKDSC